MTIKRYFGLWLCFFLSGCAVILGDKPLQMEPVPYRGNELRIDGYYYHSIDDAPVVTEEVGPRVHTYCLFRNGLVKRYGTINLSQLDQFEESIQQSRFEGRYNSSEWGVFHIENQRIKFEERGMRGHGERLGSTIFQGKVLNDTTFVLDSVLLPGSDESKPLSHVRVFHFKPLKTKPDSVNRYIRFPKR